MASSDLPQTLEQFYPLVLALAVQNLKVNTFTDNFDADRFNIDGNDHAMDFDTNARVFYFDWYFRNWVNLFNAYQLLEDDQSRLLYLHLIAYRMAGHLSIRLPVEFANKKAEFENYLSIEKSTVSKLAISGMFGKLRHFDFEYGGNKYVIDCLGLEAYLFRRQYFYEQDGVRIAPESGDFVVDGGACLGDTAAVFSNAVGANGRVYSFDPVAAHQEILQYNTKQFPHQNVVIVPAGLSDHEVVCPPIILSGYAPGFSVQNQQVPLRSLDYMVKAGEIERVDFIKLDIEGAELEALRGAKETIHQFKPKLAVSLYHKPNDLFELVTFIQTKFPFYRFRLGHYTIHQEETVLYCISEA
ncbi:FkbM family methyltransferase [Symbiopectobacterium sp. RP]|uniref:FkbM family methyltransferase n=1 Tax=Symbiopectobacterium sp. RP TaxID=3248553 RepID=UPI003D28E245